MAGFNKRKNEETSPEMNKREKKVSKGIVFTEDKIPEGVFPIGDSTFVYPTTFQGNVSLNIRRFKKHGNTFYPTSEGVTLLPAWLEYIFDRSTLPQDHEEFYGSTFSEEEKLKVKTSDFENFTLSRIIGGGILPKSFTVTSSQWNEMLKQQKDIMASTLDHIYASMDFFNAYMFYGKRELDESLPQCLDSSLGTQRLFELLRQSLYDCIKEIGDLRDPEIKEEELWGNREKEFNLAALAVEVCDIACLFYYRLWDNENVSTSFLRQVKLQDLLREVKNILCPIDACKYFDDLE